MAFWTFKRYVEKCHDLPIGAGVARHLAPHVKRTSNWDDIAVRTFKCPSGEEFQLPEEWLREAGIQDFVPGTTNYFSPPSHNARILPIAQIALPRMDKRLHLGPGGINAKRVVDVLHEIVAGTGTWPVKVMEWPHREFRYLLADGVHRFCASIVAGFTQIPIVVAWGFDGEPPL